ncbi:hypothetical protein Tco_1218635 [Tanacetum coccineum]
MLIQSQAVESEGSRQPTKSQHTPTTALPSHASVPTTLVADETVHGERGDSVERAATTATSLDAEQGSGVNTHGSDKERIKLKELMDMCTKLSDGVLDLENVRIESSAEKSLGDQEDASKQGRNKIDQDEGISCINITTAKPVTTANAPIITAGVSVSTAKPSTPPTTTTTFIEHEDLTIAQTLMKIRKASETSTRPTVLPLQIHLKDKGKGIMQEPKKPVKVKGKDQIEYDADVAQRLQAELDKEVRLEKEREEETSKAANIAEWDDVQAMMDADYELAAKLQAEE